MANTIAEEHPDPARVPPTPGRGGGITPTPVCSNSSMAADPETRANGAIGHCRCAEYRIQGPNPHRTEVPGPGWGDLPHYLQPLPPVVLFSENAKKRGPGVQVLRFEKGRQGSVFRPRSLRGSQQCA